MMYSVVGAYLSRTFGDGAVDGDLIEINVHLQNADQQTSDPVTIADNGVDEQSHESRAAPRRRERACKGGMVAKKRQQKIVKQKNVRRYRMVKGMFYAIDVMKSLQVG